VGTAACRLALRSQRLVPSPSLFASSFSPHARVRCHIARQAVAAPLSFALKEADRARVFRCAVPRIVTPARYRLSSSPPQRCEACAESVDQSRPEQATRPRAIAMRYQPWRASMSAARGARRRMPRYRNAAEINSTRRPARRGHAFATRVPAVFRYHPAVTARSGSRDAAKPRPPRPRATPSAARHERAATRLRSTAIVGRPRTVSEKIQRWSR